MSTYNSDNVVSIAQTQVDGRPNTDNLVKEYENLLERKPLNLNDLLDLESQRVKFEYKHYKSLTINPSNLRQRWNKLKEDIPGLWHRSFEREWDITYNNFFNNNFKYSWEQFTAMSAVIDYSSQKTKESRANSVKISRITVMLLNLLKRLKEYDLAIEISSHLAKIELPVHTGKEFSERVKDLERKKLRSNVK